MRRFPLGLLVAACLPWSSMAQAETPAALIDGLADRLYTIGETTGNAEEMAAAERDVAWRVQLVAMSSDDAVLTKADDHGMTPLLKASFLGYGEVVAALLNSPAVAASVGQTDGDGVSAWDYANLAMRQSLTACQPAAAQNVFALVPLLVTQPFYLKTEPYRHIRAALERAGVHGDQAKIKALWGKSCKQQSEQTRRRVAAAKDFQTAVIEEGAASMAAALKRK